jgi:hypothetical protein
MKLPINRCEIRDGVVADNAAAAWLTSTVTATGRGLRFTKFVTHIVVDVVF